MRGRDRAQQQADAQAVQRDLTATAQGLREAEEDLGLIRSIVRRKGLPLEFDPEYRLPKHDPYPTGERDDDNSDDQPTVTHTSSNLSDIASDTA
jgi:hypothetical protein